MSGFSLHEWIQSASESGIFDSEGEFTLAQDKAWEKLGSFQLPFPQAWVLKLVQAAFSSPDTRLAVVQTREETRFHFSGAPEWTRLELEKAIFDTAYKGDRSLNHLAIAVRALARKKNRPFSIQDSQGDGVAWNGSSFARLDPGASRGASKADAFSVVVTNYEFGRSRLLGGGDSARFRAEIAGALHEHCHLSGSRVSLDNKNLTSYWTDPDFGKTETSHPLTVLKAPPVPGWSSIEAKGELCSRQAKLHNKKVAVTLPSGDSEVSSFSSAAMLSFFYRPELVRADMKLDRWVHHPLDRQTRILWHSDGVIVNREPLGLEGPVGVGLVVSAEGLPTDLTGFTPLESPEKRERLRHSVAQIKPLLKALGDTLGEEPFSVNGLRSDTVLLGFLGATVAFAFPIVGVPWVVSSGFKVSKEMRENRALQTAYNEGFSSLLAYFDEYAS